MSAGLVFFHGKKGPISFIVKHLQCYVGVFFTVLFTKNDFPPTSRTENVRLWRKWDLCAGIHTSANIAMLQWNLKYHLECSLQLA